MVELRDVYILLTRSTTYFSRLIGAVTSDNYTHASIGLEGINGKFYSFGRKNIHMMLPGGFVEEHIQYEKIYSGLTKYALYKIKVTEEDYQRILDYIKSIKKRQREYAYNILGVLAIFFGLSIKRRHHFYCSQFVAATLKQSRELEKDIPDINKVRPEELLTIPNIQMISSGCIGGLTR